MRDDARVQSGRASLEHVERVRNEGEGSDSVACDHFLSLERDPVRVAETHREEEDGVDDQEDLDPRLA